MIEVKRATDDEWSVVVRAGEVTRHRVRVTKADVTRFAGDRTPEELLRASFEFLLEREPNTSILGSFDLPLIGQYFPEYEAEIRERLNRRRE